MAGDAEPLLYEPDHSPGRRQIDAARNRSTRGRVTWRCCLIASAIVGLLVGSVVAFTVGQFVYTVASHMVSPHLALVHQHSQNLTADQQTVKPLLNASSTFDVLVTVWLDVTQHTQQGHSLPDSIPIFKYTPKDGGKEIREAVIYSDRLFKNASMQAGMLRSSTRLAVPVEPFYTQTLGPATLRATFRIVPHSVPDGLDFKWALSIYPGFLPIGPRSPASKGLELLESSGPHQKAHFDRDIDEAMEHSAISVNLLSLLSSQYQMPDMNATLRSDLNMDPAMYDGSPSNRAFLNQAGLDGAQDHQRAGEKKTALYIGGDRRVWLPHVRTRSRIILLREDREFDAVKYLRERNAQLKELQGACGDFDPPSSSSSSSSSMSANTSSSSFSSSGRCQRPIRGSVHENHLEFVRQDEHGGKNDSRYHGFYAPFLAQQLSSASTRHHRTIPHHSPLFPSNSSNKGDDGSESSLKDSHCLVPMLATDESKEFFHFDWDVTFASHIYLRGLIAESFEITALSSEDKLINLTSIEQELRVRSLVAEQAFHTLSSLVLGDREHPKSRPQLVVVHLVLAFASEAILTLLSLLYWYTRTTSQGLSTKAQSIAALGSVVEALQLANTRSEEGWVSFFTVYRILSCSYSIATAFLIFAALTRLDLSVGWQPRRRRPTKGERDTHRLDEKMSWFIPLLIGILFFTYCRYIIPKEFNIVGSHSCQSMSSTATEEQQHTRFVSAGIFTQLIPTLINTSVIVQMIHNFRSKQYAGNFKLYMQLAAASLAFDMAMKRIEWLSGWVAIREPIDLASFIYFLVAIVSATQAVIYPGVPQTFGAGGQEAE